jgi:hypothetical protein
LSGERRLANLTRPGHHHDPERVEQTIHDAGEVPAQLGLSGLSGLMHG